MIVGPKKSLYKENILRFNTNEFKKKYKVEVVFEETIYDRTRVVYEVSVENLEVIASGNYLCYVVMDNFLINNKEPDLIMEQLAHKCRKPYETLVLIISKNGEIIGLNNHPDIIEKWNVLKKRLAVEYSGNEFEKYVQLTEDAIIKPEIFLSKLKNDIFISQFFYPIYEEAFIGFSKKNTESAKFFNINYKINMLLSIQDEGELNEDGNMIIKKSIDKNEYNFHQMPIDSFDTEYVLNSKSEIVKIKGKFDNHNRRCIFNIIEKIK